MLFSTGESEEDDDLEETLERKYPNLTRTHQKSYDEDIPPPIPPRPPETFARVSPPEDEDDIPPPPPPTSLPPGPPKIHRASSNLEEESSAKRIKLSDTSGSVEIEEYGFKVNPGSSDNEEESGPEENGEVLEESGSEEEVPPPIPPRSHSLTPERSGPLYDGFLGGKLDIYAENPHLENGASHFLGVRGGGQKLAPPLENHTSQSYETAPHVPAKHTHRRPPPPKPTRDSIEEEEQALLSELSELEKLASRTTYSESVGADETKRVVSSESLPSRSEPAVAAPEDQLRPEPKEEPPV